MSENSSCPWKTSGTLSHACTAHAANEFWRKCYVLDDGGEEEVGELCVSVQQHTGVRM